MENSAIVLNASNLRGGGAVQVAVSIVVELSRSDIREDIDLILSSVVVRECMAVDVDFNGFRSFREIDQFGLRFFNRRMCRLFRDADIVFTVFGPLYLWCRPKKSVVGFAQPWILYPRSDAYYKLRPLNRLVSRLKYALQRLAFSLNSDILVVEAEHARARLETIFPGKPVAVVPNALNAVFTDAIKEEPGVMAAKDRTPLSRAGRRSLCLGYVGRAYSHKNLSILPAVRQALLGNHGIEATIKVTLNQREWESQSDNFRANIENVGALSLKECVAFYRTLDGVLFSSLLESFSATPLEAMAIGLPLFASDRAFVRDFCGEIPFYFDPLDPDDIAAAIKRCCDMPAAALTAHLAKGQRHVLALPSAKQRAAKIAGILREF